jgi:hypothetical protein
MPRCARILDDHGAQGIEYLPRLVADPALWLGLDRGARARPGRGAALGPAQSPSVTLCDLDGGAKTICGLKTRSEAAVHLEHCPAGEQGPVSMMACSSVSEGHRHIRRGVFRIKPGLCLRLTQRRELGRAQKQAGA